MELQSGLKVADPAARGGRDVMPIRGIRISPPFLHTQISRGQMEGYSGCPGDLLTQSGGLLADCGEFDSENQGDY
jgi:hypothetical protein